jgi:subtilase family serine protease
MGHRHLHPQFSFFLYRSVFILLGALFALAQLQAQVAKPLVKRAIDTTEVATLAQHHPRWASAANASTAIASNQSFEQITIVLARPEAQEKAFEAFLVSQQTPGSPNYHHWLTPAEVGERFGPAASDVEAVKSWLESQGLHVNSVAPSRTMINFGGTATDLGRAFGTEMRRYTIKGETRYSISSDPTVPAALAGAIQAVHGLSEIHEQPQYAISTQDITKPLYSSGSYHYQTPADFNTIYDVPSAYTGSGITIGIVGRARVSTTDLANFRASTGTTFANPTVVIPTGATDPGAPCTSTSCSSGDQGEATLDVIRAGGTAPGATLLLVAATQASGGISVAGQYLVNTTPVPAQVMSISFGLCETQVTQSSVTFWDNLFKTAAAEGISTFVSSGDSAAAGCDDAFSAPPTTAIANSPNYICSSSYATCVGGTQFADTTSPSTYWSTNNDSTTLKSAQGYIPEGAWNESTTSSVAGTGGGVSTYITTPSWQAGTGVPSARAGRYTPDVSFSSSLHDGYLACLAQSGYSCSTVFGGTSAAAPSMAGIAALLDQKLGSAQGNLNPTLYSMAAGTNASSVFHDVTVTSSGVSSCTTTPSLCNNSIYSTSAGAVQAGFQVTTGYDQATGLGSLDVTNFLNNYAASTATSTPTVTVTPASNTITTAQSLSVTVSVSGSGTTPTGTVVLSGGGYTSSSTALSSGAASFTIAAGALSTGADTLTATYTPDSSSSSTYALATGSAKVTVNALTSTPTVTVTPASTSITTAQSLSVAVAVSGSGTTPTGTVVLSGGGYTSSSTALSSGSATITIPANTFSASTLTLTATYTPDSSSSSSYSSTTGTTTVTVTTAATPTVTLSTNASTLTLAKGATTGNTATITVTPGGGFTGAVALTATLASSPTGATSLPVVSLSPSSVTTSGTATLTVTTTAASSAALHAPEKPWYTGGMALAGLLFLLPWRRRTVRALLGTLLLCVALGAGLTGCSSGTSGGSGKTTTPGTTAGTYTITVSGTASGVTIASQTITLTVQ